MSDQESNVGDDLEIDRLCDQFELAWEAHVNRRRKDAPAIEDYLEANTRIDSRELFRELLSVELSCSTRTIDSSLRDRFIARFAEYQDVVNEQFNSILGGKKEMNHTPESVSTGSRIGLDGRYSLRQEVGRGSFGTVFRATDTKLSRDVAIKVSHCSTDFSDEYATFVSEAKTLAQLRHANLVKLYDIDELKTGQVYLVSEFIDGCTLSESIKQQRPDFRGTAMMVAKIADALHSAHSEGFVHRDVKPDNILLDANREPYLADFGLALADKDVGKRGKQGGTIAYMSPEQCRGEGHLVDGRSDIFSLGIILYELLTGSVRFGATVFIKCENNCC